MDREWGVLLKARLDQDAPAADPGRLERLLDSLPGKHKRLTGGGRDFTVAWWVEGPDAAAAVRTAADALRSAAEGLGLAHLTFIRSHAASVEGRFPPMPRLDKRAGQSDTWAVDVRAGAPESGGPMSEATLQRIWAALADPEASLTFHGDLEKFLLDDGSAVTFRLWASGRTMQDALGSAHERVLAALARVGLIDWIVVRVKAWDPAALQADTFPGAEAHRPEPTGELR